MIASIHSSKNRVHLFLLINSSSATIIRISIMVILKILVYFLLLMYSLAVIYFVIILTISFACSNLFSISFFVKSELTTNGYLSSM